MSNCEHLWRVDRTFVSTSVLCIRCPVIVDDVPWDVDPIDYASRLHPSPSRRRRLLRPGRIAR